jgi:hypothetical protein
MTLIRLAGRRTALASGLYQFDTIIQLEEA